MANFQVPQFIEIEDRIFGPLTFKQFVYLAGGGGAAFIEWVYIPVHFIAIMFIAPTVGLALALAFYKINDRPFILMMESAFHYLLDHKLYIWKKVEPKLRQDAAGQITKITQERGIAIPKLSESKLKDLSWSLDVREKIK
ncbi:MAG: PrgI family protein [Candidatus Vogelbacteria bacterium]|nr:PrgI family protein [Candidatus Vogelbacteria bacterium]